MNPGSNYSSSNLEGYYGTCPNCNGRGEIDVECNPCAGTGRRFDGEPCPHCRGLGQKAVKCIVCNGSGKIWKSDN